jgi:hypothetical protein
MDLNGKAFSPLLDTFELDIREKGFSCVQFAYPESTITGENAYGNPFHANKAWALSCIFSCVEFRFISKVIETISLGRVSLTHKFGKEAFYGKLLNLSKAKAVIGIEPYPILCKICRARGIPIVDLFHGFGYTEKVFTYLWKEEPTPNGALALDALSAETFSTKYFKEKKIWCEFVGHPFYRRVLKGKADGLIPEEYLGKPDFLKTEKKKILYSMSWGYAGDHGNYPDFEGILENGICPNEFLEAIQNLSIDCEFFFRLHPVQLRNPGKYRSIIKLLERLSNQQSNVEWEKTSKAPLPILYNYIDCQVSMRSETCYDASFFGVKSLLLCPSLQKSGPNNGHFSDLAKLGYVDYWDGKGESLNDWIQKTKKVDPSKLDIEKMEINFNKTIDRLIGGNK